MKLTTEQRAEARAIILQGARKGLAHRDAIHYTQSAARWQGFDKKLRVVKGQFPTQADCSSYTSWLLWNALTHALRDMSIPDIVNGENWRGGYTGTQREHGYNIQSPGLAHHLIVGDLIHYGGGTGKHVAIYIGDGMVFSHGSEGAPYKVPVNYRGDFNQARRYILA